MVGGKAVKDNQAKTLPREKIRKKVQIKNYSIMEKNAKNMEEKIMNKVYRKNREMYKTIRPFVKGMGWERFVREFEEAMWDHHNCNCEGKFAYNFVIYYKGEVQLVLESDNALWLEGVLNSNGCLTDVTNV